MPCLTGDNRQPACKPGSVWPWPLRTRTWQPFLWATHCCAPQATYPDDQPRKKGRACALRHPYSVLLPVGFTVPLPLPVARWALTPPFHPYPAASLPDEHQAHLRQSGGGAVCFLWHFPWGRPRRTLSGTVYPWSPDFPHPAAFRRLQAAAARPTGAPLLDHDAGHGQTNAWPAGAMVNGQVPIRAIRCFPGERPRRARGRPW